MGFDESDTVDDEDGGGKSLNSSNVTCSICLEIVTDNGNRSRAKLQCGHEFHLDCIGSAFNIKGAMQCPNCRKIEKGQWLFANGCRSFADINLEEWSYVEDLYDQNFSEMSFGVQWCPITAFPRLPPFEDGEFPSTAYHDLLGQHPIFPEHTAVSSSSHPCPFVAYYGPVSSSNSAGTLSDTSNFSTPWGGPSGGTSEMPASYTYAALDPHYHNWEHHSPPFSATSSRLGGTDQTSVPSGTQRSSRASYEMHRSGSFAPPFVIGHSSGARVGSSVTSSMNPPYPGSAARARDRVQALQAYFQPPNSSPQMHMPTTSNSRRSGGHRGGLSQGNPLLSTSDQSGSFYVLPPGTSSRNFQDENPSSGRYPIWERDYLTNFQLNSGERDSRGVPHHQGGGSGSSRQQRRGSERTPSSQNRS